MLFANANQEDPFSRLFSASNPGQKQLSPMNEGDEGLSSIFGSILGAMLGPDAVTSMREQTERSKNYEDTFDTIKALKIYSAIPCSINETIALLLASQVGSGIDARTAIMNLQTVRRSYLARIEELERRSQEKLSKCEPLDKRLRELS